MRGANRFLGSILLVGLVLALGACAKGNLDDGDSANVALVVQNVPQIPPITASPAPGGVGCAFTVTPVNATLGTRPKSELALTTTFSDVVMDNVVLNYQWVGGTGPVSQDTQPVSGTIQPNGTQTVSFMPIRLDYLSGSQGGTTAGLTMVFNGHTVDGHNVQATGGGAVSINSCTTTTVCGDGAISGSETCDDRNTLSGDGCSSTCQIEQGWRCAGQPSVCTPITIP